ncbi:PAS domain S-box protein [Pusillimonas sp.]|uniref:PAS domain S-box protein n=1 Tax=Pusillimonas sp. TaxID=3040095 RepID=UPI0037C67EF7
MPPTVATASHDFSALFHEIFTRSSEGILLIDKRGRITWANEAALRMHDADGPADLGGTAAGYRKRHSLRFRNLRPLSPEQYPIDRLKRNGSFNEICLEVRRKNDDGFRRILEFRGLALENDGNTFSRALVMLDATEKHEAQERFEKTFNVNPAPAIICKLADLRYIKVNHGFLGMTGYRRQDLIGKSAHDIDVLRQAEQRQEALESLEQGATIPQMEAVLRRSDGSDLHVIVAGQPVDVDSDPCMLFTFIDLTARRQAQERLRQSEEIFSTAFRLAPVPMTLSTLADGQLLEVNEAFLRTTGHADIDDANQALSKQELWLDPDAQENLAKLVDRDGSIRNVEIQLRLRSGQFLDCLASAEMVTIGSDRCILWVIQDITQRKRSEAELMQAIEVVMQDASWFSRSVIEKLAQLRGSHGKAGKSAELADLTQREHEILVHMCQGSDDREIGRALGISPHTVRNHVAAVYSKIGVHRRGAAIIWALERGMGG